MKFPESALAHQYLDGLRGVEIGGSAHNAFGLNTVNVDYTDDMSTIFKQAERDMCGEAMPVDIVAPGDKLPFLNSSVDFVISSHVVEHFWNPIAALMEWKRVVRPGGIIYTIVPHPERTFDKGRPYTTQEELMCRHAGVIKQPAGEDPHGHWSVWNVNTFARLCRSLGLKIMETRDPDEKVGNGFTVVCRVEKTA